MSKKNANFSPSYEESYGQKSTPELGARVPESKKPRVADNHDTGKAYAGAQTPEQVLPAKEDEGAARAAIDQQIGRGTKTGGAIGDAATHPQSGCSTKDE
jgi:hypothetical protein